MFIRTDKGRKSPCSLRSSVRKAMPLRTASRGLRILTGSLAPYKYISPLSARSAPNRARIISVRPEPISPATPRISPRRTSKLTSLTLSPTVSPTTRRAAWPAALVRRGCSCSKSRPTIIRIISLTLTSLVGLVEMTFPSLSTVTRSAMRMTSSMRCEI